MVYSRYHIFGLEIFRFKFTSMDQRKTLVSPVHYGTPETDDLRIRSRCREEHSLVC